MNEVMELKLASGTEEPRESAPLRFFEVLKEKETKEIILRMNLGLETWQFVLWG